MSRDRDARVTATIARGCGFDQPAAVLVVRHLPPVTALLARDDATVRRVLDDPATRRPLVEGVRAAFKNGWQRATLERMRSDHEEWLDAWWLPVCTDAELRRVRTAPALRPSHHRVGWPTASFPATSGAAHLLLDEHHRRELAGHLLVERRFADAVQRLAERVDDPLTTGQTATVGSGRSEVPPDGLDPDAVADVGWWHG